MGHKEHQVSRPHLLNDTWLSIGRFRHRSGWPPFKYVLCVYRTDVMFIYKGCNVYSDYVRQIVQGRWTRGEK